MTTAPADELLAMTYQAWLRAAGCTDRTIDERLRAVRRLIRAAGSVEAIEATHVIAYVGHCPAASSRAAYYMHAASFARFLAANGRPVAWLEPVPRPRSRAGVPRPIADDELFAAIDQARGRERTMLLLAAYQGLRVHEIGKIRGEDVSEQLLHVRGKGQSSHELPTHPLVWREARRYSRTGYWFPGQGGRGSLVRSAVWRTMHRALARVGSTATPHQLRHWYATTLLRNGTNLRVVQELLRHATPATVAIYTLVTAAERQAAQTLMPMLPERQVMPPASAVPRREGCPPWCTTDHSAAVPLLDVLEGFTHTGCIGRVRTEWGAAIEVVRSLSDGDDGPVIFIDNAATSLTADEAEAVAASLLDAAALLRCAT